MFQGSCWCDWRNHRNGPGKTSGGGVLDYKKLPRLLQGTWQKYKMLLETTPSQAPGEAGRKRGPEASFSFFVGFLLPYLRGDLSGWCLAFFVAILSLLHNTSQCINKRIKLLGQPSWSPGSDTPLPSAILSPTALTERELEIRGEEPVPSDTAGTTRGRSPNAFCFLIVSFVWSWSTGAGRWVFLGSLPLFTLCINSFAAPWRQLSHTPCTALWEVMQKIDKEFTKIFQWWGIWDGRSTLKAGKVILSVLLQPASFGSRMCNKD